jgi:hypothetical protein
VHPFVLVLVVMVDEVARGVVMLVVMVVVKTETAATTTYVEGPRGPDRHWLVKLESQRWHRLVANCLFVRRCFPSTEPADAGEQQSRPPWAESCARIDAGSMMRQSSSCSC